MTAMSTILVVLMSLFQIVWPSILSWYAKFQFNMASSLWEVTKSFKMDAKVTKIGCQDVTMYLNVNLSDEFVLQNFQLNLTCVSENEVIIKFSRRSLWHPYWSYLCLWASLMPWCPKERLSLILAVVREENLKIYFQDGGHIAFCDITIWTNLYVRRITRSTMYKKPILLTWKGVR